MNRAASGIKRVQPDKLKPSLAERIRYTPITEMGPESPRLESGDEWPFRRANRVEEWDTINMDYAHEGHTVHLVVYHLIWCPKRRRKVLVGPIRTRLEQIAREVAVEHAWTAIELAIQPDHVHVFIWANPRRCPQIFHGSSRGEARAICGTSSRTSRDCPRCGRGVSFSARRAM